MIKDLIKLANSLDGSGYITEANIVDKIIKSAAAPAASATKIPEVGFYQCGHFNYQTFNYFDGRVMYNVLIPNPRQYLKLTFSTSEGLKAHTNNSGNTTGLKDKIDSKDRKLSDREFATAIGMATGWYKVVDNGQYVNPYEDNYYNVGPDYSVLKVLKDGSSSRISLYNFFKELGGKGAIVKQDEYSRSVNAQNAAKMQEKEKAEKEAEETAEVPVMGDEILRAKRGKSLTDRTYTYATSPDGLSFSWRHIRSGRTGQFSKEKNPDKWIDAVRNLNEARTTEIK